MVNSVLELSPADVAAADAAAATSAASGATQDDGAATTSIGSAPAESAVAAAMGESEQKKQKSVFTDANKKAEDFRNYGKDTPRYETVRAFYEEQHAKQTYEFATAMLQEYTGTSRCTMPVWDALMYLNGVVDDSDPDTDLDQLAHAVQTAEAARRAHPGEEFDWLHVTGFIHDLGKIMAVKEKGFKGLPQWAVVGDNFPVGCRFDDSIVFHEYFAANPDNQDPRYNTKLGVYSENCGLKNVTFSWSHDEYLYRVAKEQSTLPKEALAVLRYHSFYAMHHMGAYSHLLDDEDREVLPWIKRFQKFDLYSKSTEVPDMVEVMAYYKEKINKYFPNPVEW